MTVTSSKSLVNPRCRDARRKMPDAFSDDNRLRLITDESVVLELVELFDGFAPVRESAS